MKKNKIIPIPKTTLSLKEDGTIMKTEHSVYKDEGKVARDLIKEEKRKTSSEKE